MKVLQPPPQLPADIVQIEFERALVRASLLLNIETAKNERGKLEDKFTMAKQIHFDYLNTDLHWLETEHNRLKKASEAALENLTTIKRSEKVRKLKDAERETEYYFQKATRARFALLDLLKRPETLRQQADKEYEKVATRCKELNRYYAANDREKEELLGQVNSDISFARKRIESQENKIAQAGKNLASFDGEYVDPFLRNNYPLLPKKKLWMLVIDARDHRHGKFCYNLGLHSSGKAEPHYIEAGVNALIFMLKTRSEVPDMTIDYMKKLHYLSLLNVTRKGKRDQITAELDINDHLFSGGLLPLQANNSSSDGIREACDFSFGDCGDGFDYNNYRNQADEILRHINDKEFQCFWKKCYTYSTYHGAMSQKMLKYADEEYCIALQNIINDYKRSKTNLPAELKEIVKKLPQQNNADPNAIPAIVMISDYGKKGDWLHPASDGNVRLKRLEMLKLLCDEGLPFTCMENPNILDGETTLKIVTEVINGINYFIDRAQVKSNAVNDGFFRASRIVRKRKFETDGDGKGPPALFPEGEFFG